MRSPDSRGGKRYYRWGQRYYRCFLRLQFKRLDLLEPAPVFRAVLPLEAAVPPLPSGTAAAVPLRLPPIATEGGNQRHHGRYCRCIAVPPLGLAVLPLRWRYYRPVPLEPPLMETDAEKRRYRQR